MKICSKSLALFWLGWTICLTFEVSAKTGFYPQNEYVYEYTGEVNTNLPNVARQGTSVGIKTLVSIQPIGNDLFIKFTGLKYRGVLEGFAGHAEEYSPLKSGDKELALGFKIQYQSNSDEFKGIEVSQNDPVWSVNIKKAFTAFFNVRLDKQLSRREGYFAAQKPAGSFDPIDVTESGIEGTCQSKYIYQQQPWPGNPYAHVLNVTKIRNMTSCKDRPIWRQSINDIQKCASCESFHETFVSHGSVATYNAYEENGNYILQSAESNTLSHITPFPPEGDNLRITEHQKLLLKEIKRSKGRPDFPGPGINHHIIAITPEDVNLKAIYKRSIKDSKSSFGSKISPLKQTLTKEEPKQKVQRLMGELSNNCEDVYRIISQDALVAVPELVDNLRLITYEEIQQLYTTFETDENKRKLFIDTVVMTGTEASVLFIKYLIEQRKIVGEHAAEVISSLPAYILDPQPAILEEIWPLCKDRSISGNRQIYATTLMAFGEIVYQACVPKQQPKTTRPHHIRVAGCPSSLTTRYIKELISMFEQSKEMWEKSTIMYTLYHMGLPEILDHLVPYFQQKLFNLPTGLASEVIFALAKTGPARQTEVAKYLLPIFYNTTVPTEVRIAVFEVLAYITTSQALINQLAQSTWNEPDPALSKYIYSYLKGLESITIPCWAPMAVRARQARKLAKPSTVGLLDSRMKMISTYIEKFGMGSAMTYSFYHSHKFMFPSVAYVHIGTELAGHYASAFEISAITDGIQKLLDFTVGPKADYSTKTKYSDIFKSETATDDGPRYKDEFRVTPRKDETFFSRIKLTYLQSRHRLFFLDDKTLDDLRNSGLLPPKKDLYSAIRDGIPINYRQLTMLEDTVIKFSSHIGLPMTLQFKMPAYEEIRGKFTVELAKTGITNALSNVILKPEITITSATKGWVAITTDVPFDKKTFITTATSANFLSIPFYGNINADLTQQSFSVSLRKSSTTSQEQFQPNFQAVVVPKVILIDHSKRTKVEKTIGLSKVEGTSWLPDQDQTKDDNDLGILHYLTFGWAPKSFKYSIVELPPVSDSKTETMELYVNWKHTPSPFEEQLWRGKSSLQRLRLWNVIPEWKNFPVFNCKDVKPLGYIEATTQPPKKSWFSRMKDKFSFGRSGGDDEEEEKEDRGRVLHPHLVTGDSDSGLGGGGHSSLTSGPQSRSVSGYGDYGQTTYGQHPDGLSQTSNGYESERIKGKKSTVHKLNFKDESSTTLIAVKLIRNRSGGTKQQINSDITITRNAQQGSHKITMVTDHLYSQNNVQNTYKLCLSADHYSGFSQCLNAGHTFPSFDYKLYWGPTCTSNNYLFIKGTYDKQPELPEVRRLYQQTCADDIKKGFSVREECTKLHENINLLTKAHYEIQFSQLGEFLSAVLQKIDEKLKCKFSDYLTKTDASSYKGEAGKITIDAQYHLDKPLLDVIIKKPQEQILLKNFYYPELQPLLFPRSSSSSNMHQLLNRLTNEKLNTQCVLTENNIRTFNQVNYNYTLMDQDTCTYVLAMDCSPSKLFTVTVARKPNKKINVEILGHTIESSPVPATQKKVEFLVDGKSNFIEEGQIAVVRSIGDEDRFLTYVAHTGEGAITIKSPPLGLWVTYSNTGIRVIVSEFWKGKVCGLCGEDNEAPQYTFLGPDQCLYGEPSAFINSYRLQTPQCQQSRPISSYNVNKPQCLPLAPSNLEKLTGDGHRPSLNCPFPPCRPSGHGQGERYNPELTQTTGGFHTSNADFHSQVSQTSGGGFPDEEYNPETSQTTGRFPGGSQYPGGHRRPYEPGYVTSATIKEAPETYAQSGDTVTLTCYIPPTHQVIWYYNDKQLFEEFHTNKIHVETTRHEDHTNSKLKIYNAQPAESGNYTCSSSNANNASVIVRIFKDGNVEEPFTAQVYTPLGSDSDMGPCYMRRNLVKRRTDPARGGSEHQFCISTKVVKQCRLSCLAVDFSPESVEFQCYKESSKEARELAVNAEQGDLTQIPHSSIKFDETMMITKTCIPKN